METRKACRVHASVYFKVLEEKKKKFVHTAPIILSLAYYSFYIPTYVHYLRTYIGILGILGMLGM